MLGILRDGSVSLDAGVVSSLLKTEQDEKLSKQDKLIACIIHGYYLVILKLKQDPIDLPFV
jgi:hypothetical protein